MDTLHIPSEQPPAARHRWHIRSFPAILLLTAAVWVFVAMSESRDYPLQVQVRMSGFDADRYAVLQADTAVAFQVQTSGFSALAISLRRQPMVLPVDMSGSGNRRAVAVADLVEPLRQQLSRYRFHSVSSQRDSLRLLLAPRASRTMSVDISSLQVSFADGYGLYGEPTVSPAEVTLYGPQQALDAVSAVRLAPAAIADLGATASHQLPLEIVGRSQGEVALSVRHVDVTIPVEAYVERSFSLPVSVHPADSTLRLRLYPDRATVRLWVARRDLPLVSPSAFTLCVERADILSRQPSLTPRLTRFPDCVRIRSVEPAELQYVIIQ